MVYVVFFIGALIGLAAVYLFFIKATPEQVKEAASGVALALYVLLLLYFALIGRVIISIVLLLPAIPLVFQYVRKKRTKGDPKALEHKDKE